MTLPEVKFRTADESDATDIAELHQDPDFQKYVGGPTSEKECAQRIAEWNKHMRENDQLYYVIENDFGDFIGMLAVLPNHEEAVAHNLTISLLKIFQGRGNGQAAVTKCIVLAKQNPNIKKLCGLVEDENFQSKMLMKRFDAHPTSRFVSMRLPDREVLQWKYNLL